MKRTATSRPALVHLRAPLALLFILAGFLLAISGSALFAANEESTEEAVAQPDNFAIQFGQDYYHDISPALRDLPAIWPPKPPINGEDERGREARMNPQLPMPLHVDEPDPVVDHGILGLLAPNTMPGLTLNFDGILFPGVACNCAPPDTNGAIGTTQYVQMVNEGYQVFNKTTGASVLGPNSITSLWSGFGGVCESNGHGDPVVLYDKIANRWLISQFAGASVPTDECIAISTTSDATGTYFRYAFHLGTNFFDYPHLGVWPDGYYMAMNVFNTAGTTFLGPQAFAFDRSKMLIGAAATFVSPGITGGGTEPTFLPADLDGSIQPAAGVGNPFVSFPGSGTYKVRLFHADFATPANTTFTQIGAPAAAGFTQLCPGTRSCVPQLGTATRLDGIGDRLMFRAAYRKFNDGHEAIVSNFTVSSGGVAGVRWFELRAVTTSPTLFQESTHQPDATSRWMGSAAMDRNGDLAIGFSASSSSINPQIRYAGRLSTDTINTLAQGEAIFTGVGTGSQTNINRWGDYSNLTIDPADDCTFWYTQEYLSTNGTSWRTRIGNFRFSQCTATPTPTPIPTISISGSIDYCPNPSLDPVPGALMTLSGSAAGVTLSDGSGNYSFTSLPSGGNYTVTPTKSALPPGSNGISTIDVVAVQRHFLNITLLPPGCRLTAADVNGDTGINTIDVIAIQRFFLAISTGIANTGKYSFSPASRSYLAVSGNQTNQNYDALVFGDVASSFVHRPAGSDIVKASAPDLPATVTKIMLPEITVDRSRNDLAAPVTVTAIDGSSRLVAFQGDFTFDESVVTFQSEPVQKEGLTNGNWNVSGNVLPGPGPIRTLRISAFSNDFTPLSGSGTLFQLKMLRVGKTAQSTQLIWAAPPSDFFFIDADLATQKPSYAMPGSVAQTRNRGPNK